MTPLRVCLVGLQCYDLLTRAPHPRLIGGAERQQVFLARGLAASGHKVAFVTTDYGQDGGVCVSCIPDGLDWLARCGVPERTSTTRWQATS